MHDRKSDSFAETLLIHPPEHRATKKPLLAGYKNTCCPFFRNLIQHKFSAMDFYTMTNEVRVIKGNIMKKMT